MALHTRLWTRDDGIISSNPVTGITYGHVRSSLPGRRLRSSSIPSQLAFQPMDPPSVTSSVHHSMTVPVLWPAPQTVFYICLWMDNGIICETQITWASVPEHLTIHGVTNMAHDHRVPCRWWGCLTGGKEDGMDYQSIVRHVRDVHLGHSRVL